MAITAALVLVSARCVVLKDTPLWSDKLMSGYGLVRAAVGAPVSIAARLHNDAARAAKEVRDDSDALGAAEEGRDLEDLIVNAVGDLSHRTMCGGYWEAWEDLASLDAGLLYTHPEHLLDRLAHDRESIRALNPGQQAMALCAMVGELRRPDEDYGSGCGALVAWLREVWRVVALRRAELEPGVGSRRAGSRSW
jgi:hypothetical protein